jgi:predicted metal-dependent peptidase
MDADLKLSRAKTYLASKEPFYGSCLLELRYKENNDIPTMCVDGVSIFWNREFVDELTEAEVRGVLVHEAEHVLLGHHIRMMGRDHKKWNWATDHAINNTINNNIHLELPKGALLNSDYWNVNAEKIYPDAPENYKGGIGDIALLPASDGGDTPSKADLQDEEMKVNQMLCRAIESASRAQGTIPAYAQELIKKMRRPKKNWKDTIFTMISTRGYTDFTMARPNRRMLANYDLYLPSMFTQRIGKIAFVFDTSGSMSSKDLELSLGLLHAIQQDYNPECIIAIDADAEVADVKIFREGDDIRDYKINGRGGTDVEPAFKYVNEHHPDIQLLLYATDLCVGSFPKLPQYPVVWMCTRDDGTAPWGTVVKLGEAA